MADTRYKRVLLKLSGEAFSGEAKFGIDAPTLRKAAQQIKHVMEMGVDVAIVVGGGNIWRGSQAEKDGIDRVTADYAGMLATVINSLALSSALTAIGQKNRVYTSIRMEPVGELYSKWKAIESMQNGEVAILSGGTGNPFFTTDTAAALRAIEVEAEVLLMSKNGVDGIYSEDPRKISSARKFDCLTYMEALNLRLEVMDTTALSLCMENKLPIVVFNLDEPRSLERAVLGEPIGTIVKSEKKNVE